MADSQHKTAFLHLRPDHFDPAFVIWSAMKRTADRIAIAAKINEAAKLYRTNLVGKSFMYVFDGRFIEVIYKAVNFKHLTGVDTQLSALEFYRLASKGRLQANQIGFSARHPYRLCQRKVAHIGQLATLAMAESFILEDVTTQTQTFKFGTTDLNFSVLMNERSGCFVAESLRDEDCFTKSDNVHTVTHIFSRPNDTKEYDELLYRDKAHGGDDLPDEVLKLLAAPALAEVMPQEEPNSALNTAGTER